MFNIKWGIISGGIAFILSLAVGGLSGAAFIHVLFRALIFLVVFFALGIGGNFLINTYLPELLQGDVPEKDSLTQTRNVERPGSRINISLGEGGAVPEMYQKSGSSEEMGNISELKLGVEEPAVNTGLEPSTGRNETQGGSLLGAGEDAAAVEAGKSVSGNDLMEGFGMDQMSQDQYTLGGMSVLEEQSLDEGDFSGPALQDKSGRKGGEDVFKPSPAISGPVFTAAVSEGDLGGLPDLDAMSGAFLSGGDEDDSGTPVIESILPERKPSSSKPQAFEGDYNPKELAAGIRTVLEKDK